MFATAFDSSIVDENNEKIYFRFDNHPSNSGKGNLKIAVLTDKVNAKGLRIVRCYTIADRQNSLGSRFSQAEQENVEEKLLNSNIAGIKRPRNLFWEEYKIFIWADNLGEDEEEEAIKCKKFPEFDDFKGNAASKLDDFQSITRM